MVSSTAVAPLNHPVTRRDSPADVILYVEDVAARPPDRADGSGHPPRENGSLSEAALLDLVYEDLHDGELIELDELELEFVLV